MTKHAATPTLFYTLAPLRRRAGCSSVRAQHRLACQTRRTEPHGNGHGQRMTENEEAAQEALAAEVAAAEEAQLRVAADSRAAASIAGRLR